MHGRHQRTNGLARLPRGGCVDEKRRQRDCHARAGTVHEGSCATQQQPVVRVDCLESLLAILRRHHLLVVLAVAASPVLLHHSCVTCRCTRRVRLVGPMLVGAILIRRFALVGVKILRRDLRRACERPGVVSVAAARHVARVSAQPATKCGAVAVPLPVIQLVVGAEVGKAGRSHEVDAAVSCEQGERARLRPFVQVGEHATELAEVWVQQVKAVRADLHEDPQHGA
mmetsp:Transcript_4731/g.18894  ORF Transcript_4731/g.18894 Transcript_4731/m.18894 type:complete len:227 (-) Transcript_4731:892-1572(-)